MLTWHQLSGPHSLFSAVLHLQHRNFKRLYVFSVLLNEVPNMHSPIGDVLIYACLTDAQAQQKGSWWQRWRLLSNANLWMSAPARIPLPTPHCLPIFDQLLSHLLWSNNRAGFHRWVHILADSSSEAEPLLDTVGSSAVLRPGQAQRSSEESCHMEGLSEEPSPDRLSDICTEIPDGMTLII